MTFITDAQSISDELVLVRRQIHQDPEIGNQLPRTQQRVLSAIEGLGLEVTLGSSLSSVVAVLRGATPGPTVLLRADMDALPIHEKTGLEFASSNGAMHACGHDMHTAALVGAAKLLSARREQMRGNVVFMFQPGEEGPGGAEPMIAEGLLDVTGEKPTAAYAFHVMPGSPGIFSTIQGSMMAGTSDIHIEVHGKGGHASEPHTSVDPVPVAAEIVLALQTYRNSRFSAFEPLALTVTMVRASDASNIIPDSASITATTRYLSEQALDQIKREIPLLVEGISSAHGCHGVTQIIDDYPLTVNEPTLTRNTIELLRESFGEARVRELTQPSLGSEDFSFIANEVPGVYIDFSAAQPVPGHDDVVNHSPYMAFDDRVLCDLAAAYALVAWQHLNSAETTEH
jgi:hippurate hydrolase